MYDSYAVKKTVLFKECQSQTDLQSLKNEKNLTISYPKPMAETFFFVLELSNTGTQILAPLRLFFYPRKLLFILPTNWRYDKVPSHSTCPGFRLHKGKMQKRSCCKNNYTLTDS